MNYDKFVTSSADFAIFGEDLFSTLDWPKGGRSLQLNRWVRSGKLIRLKRGLYTLPSGRRNIGFSIQWLANRLYSPSYLSLEFVLSWYDLIPERVNSLTSISTLKTSVFNNSLGNFVYRHVKDKLFFGFEEKQDEFQKRILVASPEKAILDFIYLNRKMTISRDFFDRSCRFQQLEHLNKSKLKKYSSRFESSRITQATDILLEMV